VGSVLVALIVVAATALLVAGVVWVLWPARKGGIAASADKAELDALIEEVGNVDRPRTPGESGIGGGGGFPGG
jgi:cbb3-type cytochrome oxidase subunit 3